MIRQRHTLGKTRSARSLSSTMPSHRRPGLEVRQNSFQLCSLARTWGSSSAFVFFARCCIWRPSAHACGMLYADTPPDGQIRRNCDFYDMQIFEDLANCDERSHRVNEFLKCMALCNTVVPHYKGGSGGETLLPVSLVQSWITSGGPHTASSALARSIGTIAPMVGQRSNPRPGAAPLREGGMKASDDKGATTGGVMWQYNSVSRLFLTKNSRDISCVDNCLCRRHVEACGLAVLGEFRVAGMLPALDQCFSQCCSQGMSYQLPEVAVCNVLLTAGCFAEPICTESHP